MIGYQWRSYRGKKKQDKMKKKKRDSVKENEKRNMLVSQMAILMLLVIQAAPNAITTAVYFEAILIY